MRASCNPRCDKNYCHVKVKLKQKKTGGDIDSVCIKVVSVLWGGGGGGGGGGFERKILMTAACD